MRCSGFVGPGGSCTLGLAPRPRPPLGPLSARVPTMHTSAFPTPPRPSSCRQPVLQSWLRGHYFPFLSWPPESSLAVPSVPGRTSQPLPEAAGVLTACPARGPGATAGAGILEPRAAPLAVVCVLGCGWETQQQACAWRPGGGNERSVVSFSHTGERPFEPRRHPDSASPKGDLKTRCQRSPVPCDSH